MTAACVAKYCGETVLDIALVLRVMSTPLPRSIVDWRGRFSSVCCAKAVTANACDAMSATHSRPRNRFSDMVHLAREKQRKKRGRAQRRGLKCAAVCMAFDGFSAGAPIVLGRSMRPVAQYPGDATHRDGLWVPPASAFPAKLREPCGIPTPCRRNDRPRTRGSQCGNRPMGSW